MNCSALLRHVEQLTLLSNCRMLLATEPERGLAAIYELGFVSPGERPGELNHDPRKAVCLGPARKGSSVAVHSDSRRIFVCGSTGSGKVIKSLQYILLPS
jgi:hypothetical protein